MSFSWNPEAPSFVPSAVLPPPGLPHPLNFNVVDSRPGPKSRDEQTHEVDNKTSELVDARVGLLADSPEATQAFTAASSEANIGRDTLKQPHRKKKLRKAALEASHTAITVYRGTLHTARSLQSHRMPIPASPSSRPPRPPFSKPKLAQQNRCRFLCWNASGLTSLVWAELQHWLRNTDLDIVCIQETWWKDDLEWADAHWSYVHHGSGLNKQAGLLMCVARRFAPPSSVRHTALVPGRLQHVRITPREGHQPLDVLHMYQFAWNHRKQDDRSDWWRDCMTRRAQFLLKLSAALRGIPKRNVLCLLGDANTQLPSQTGVVGQGIPPSPGPQRDAQELLELLQTFSLTAVNTFGEAPGGTFCNSATGHMSQIDFVFLRSAHSDGISKQTRPLQEWPVAKDRQGMNHIPLQGSMQLRWCPWQATPATQAPRLRPRQIWEAAQADPTLLDAFRLELSRLLPARPSIAIMDRCLKKAWAACAPVIDPAPAAQQPCDQVPCLWRLRAQRAQLSQRVGGTHPRSPAQLIWQLWSTTAKILRMEREVARQKREKRRRFLLEQTGIAEQAAQQGRITTVYRVVRTLAPKQDRAKLQIRDSEGNLQGPAAECRSLLAHFRDTYQAPLAQLSCVTPCRTSLLDSESCAAALASLPALKTVHPAAAPGVLWKYGASQLGAPLSHCLNQAFASLPRKLPLEIRQVAMCLVPKPGKKAQQPGDARPISLLHPASKAHARVLTQQLSPYLQRYIQNAPQFAYCQGRSATEALHRVVSHFHACRARAARATMVQRRRDGVTRAPCVGGLTFSLDIAQAFDTLPRWVIVAGLREAEVPQSLIDHVLGLHAQILIEITHHGCQAQCNTARGIRQGCPLSPALWAIASTYVFHRLCESLGPNTTDIITMFADDVIAQWDITNGSDLEDCIKQLARLAYVLRAHGMSVSAQKSVILYQLHGPLAQRILGSRRFKDKGVAHLRVDSELAFPVVRKHKYLGLMLSYSALERHSVEYRCRRAGIVFSRLRPVLRARHLLSQRTRIRLWFAIVWPSLRYGLTSLQLELPEVQRIAGIAARHLRILTHQLGHETHITNTQLFAQLNFDPLQRLRQEADGNRDRYQALPGELRPQRVTQWHGLVIASLQNSVALATTAATPPAPAQPSERPTLVDAVCSAPAPAPSPPGTPETHTAEPCSRAHFAQRGALTHTPQQNARLHEVTLVTRLRHSCPECGIAFATSGILRTHRVKMHGITARATMRAEARMNNQVQHSKGGVPTCKHCHAEFNGWRNFNLHILLGNCPVLNAGSEASSADAVQRSPHAGSRLLGHSCRDGVPPPEVSASPPPVPPAPLVPPSEFVPKLVDEPAAAQLTAEQKRDWKAFAAESALHTRMRNHCPECNLWANDPSRIKVHLRAKHPELKSRLEQTEQIARSVAVGRPCRLCQQDYRCAPIRHAVGCPILWQSIFASLDPSHVGPDDHPALVGAAGRAGVGRLPSVHAGITGGQASTVGKPTASHPRDAGEAPQRGRQGAQGQGQERGKGEDTATPASGSGRAHRASPDLQHVDPASHQTRGHVKDPAVGHFLHPLDAHRAPHRHPGRPLQSGGKVEGGQGGEAAQDLPAPGALDVCLEGVSTASSSCPPHCRNPEQHDQAGVPQGRSLVVLEVGPGGEPSHPGHDTQGHRHGGGSRASQRSGASVRGRNHSDQVRADEATSCGTQRTLADVLGIHRKPNESVGSTVCEPHLAVRERLLPSHRDVTEAREAHQIHSGAAAAETSAGSELSRVKSGPMPIMQAASFCTHPPSTVPAARPPPPSPVPHRALQVTEDHILKARLLNRSNVCYSNATALCLLWASLFCRQDLIPRALLSSLAALLLKHKPILLWDVLPYKQLLRDWPRPGQQHCAAEFLKHYQANSDMSGLYGVWQARSPSGEVRYMGVTCPLPVTVPLVEGDTLQAIIDRWTAQSEVHALWYAPACIALQLSRYDNGKVLTPVSLSPDRRIFIPTFVASDTHTQRVAFVLRAAVVHLGAVPTSGHYRATFFQEARVMYADDGRASVLATARHLAEISANCYILYLTRE